MHFLNLSNGVNPIASFVLDLLFPIVCQGCSAEGTWLCLTCQGKISPAAAHCMVCGKNSFVGKIHDSCRSRDVYLSGVMVAADYKNESVQKLIWNLKYNSVRAIGQTLGLVLADFFIGQDLLDYFGAAAVVPVPLHRARQRHRGFNQAALVAAEFCSRTGLEYCDVLTKTKNTARQVDLEKKEREKNVKAVFTCPPLPSFGERRIILVDDVATTGATLNECARVLHTQKTAEIWGMVVAKN